MGKKSFPIINYISWCNSLISTFTSPVGYERKENHRKIPFFTYGCRSQGVKLLVFFKWGGSKTFQKRHYRNSKCLNIANLVNTRVAEIIKYLPHGGSNHLLSVKSIKIEKKEVLVISAVLASLAC